jgi:hypothetical protein
LSYTSREYSEARPVYIAPSHRASNWGRKIFGGYDVQSHYSCAEESVFDLTSLERSVRGHHQHSLGKNDISGGAEQAPNGDLLSNGDMAHLGEDEPSVAVHGPHAIVIWFERSGDDRPSLAEKKRSLCDRTM